MTETWESTASISLAQTRYDWTAVRVNEMILNYQIPICEHVRGGEAHLRLCYYLPFIGHVASLPSMMRCV